ncbi:MAG: phosphoenolpyruvate carboxykinase (ATP) [Candidatus Dadabacteria bacterium]|nr:phosphoenolpyruvate carboxykinase (ATP) [Candidatus Dadabacteria bacterium]
MTAQTKRRKPGDVLSAHGIKTSGAVYHNLSVPRLYEQALSRNEAMVAEGGGLVAYTGRHTGRSPGDRFIVRDSRTKDSVNWGQVNRPISPANFNALYKGMAAYLSKKDVFVKDLCVCAHPKYRSSVRVINELAWHNIFANNLFIRPEKASAGKPDFTVMCAPGFEADPKKHGTNSKTFIILNFTKKMALIGGTEYAGEMKKSIFTTLNFLLPDRDVFPMHCSANVGARGDTALFFGLSGTGKTTLSADSERKLIGDDEHGWFSGGIFNFEGGCYAKAIRLNPETEPEIYSASVRFGSILENVEFDEQTRKIDFDGSRHTENTRVAYQIDALPGIVESGTGPAPKNIFMLTYDAFGVLPPISRLTPRQAMDFFLLGYTAKVAGTERGVKEPQTTFSSCFGAPFLPRQPRFYAAMLEERMKKSGARVWLLNTGISGGPYGVGKRMPLPQTRALVKAALDKTIDKSGFVKVPVFGLQVPKSCPNVPAKLLQPRKCWKSAAQYDAKAAELKERFELELLKHRD